MPRYKFTQRDYDVLPHVQTPNRRPKAIIGKPSVQRIEIARCAIYPSYFATRYLRTFDQARERICPFPDWPYLSEFLDSLQEPGDIVLVKPRDMMFSWAMMAYFLWGMLFNVSWSGFAISRKEAEVDDGGEYSTPESLFGRIRFMWKQLPPWLKPPFAFSKLKIRNLEEGMNSYVTGESANPSSGRNVACTVKFADEFAFIARQEQERLDRSMRYGSYRTLVYGSTPEPGTFYEKIIKTPGHFGFRVLTWNWSDRPDRDAGWFARQQARSSGENLALEVGASFDAARPEHILRPYFNEAVQVTTEAPAAAELANVRGGIDYGFLRGAAVVVGEKGGKLWVLAEFYPTSLSTRDFARGIAQIEADLGISCPWYCGKDRPDLLQDLGLEGIAGYAADTRLREGLGRLINLFKGDVIRIRADCRNLVEEAQNFRWASRAGVLLDHPAPGQADHLLDALRYAMSHPGPHDAPQSEEWEEGFVPTRQLVERGDIG